MNLVKALRWMSLAAERGHAEAQYNLGRMYAEGRGVSQHDRQAYKWLELAATRSSDPEVRRAAVKTRELVAARMSAEQRTEAQRSAKAWKPTRSKLFVAPTQ